MSLFSQTLLHNSIYLGVALVLMLTLTLIFRSMLLQLAGFFVNARFLGVSAESKDASRRQIQRLTLLLIVLATLLLVGGTLLATWRQVRIGDQLRSYLEHLQTQDWLQLGIAAAKTAGVIFGLFIAARILVTALHYLSERQQGAQNLAGHRNRYNDLLGRLRVALGCTIFFGALLLLGQLLGLSDRALHIVWIPAVISVAFYVARFAAGTAHLAIDVLFDLSDSLSRVESPLRYLGRLVHLSKVTKRTADYFIYVGIATWAVDTIKPDTWASPAGRLAIRIIAIFYISRVLIEVCVLLMNELFLSPTEQQSDAERQQRQTLVPVAAGVLRYGIYFTAIVMALREAGLDPLPLLAGAGIVGVAVGLGAQAFVGDLVAGFFILFENLFLVGDLITVGEVTGKVEEIGVRVTRIRDDAGILHAIPNGEVRKVSSHSRGYVNVVIDIPVPYGENLHQVFDALSRKTVELRESHAEIMGLTEFALEDIKESALLLRTVTMVKPGTDPEISSILRLAFWEALSAAGISAPAARFMLIAPGPDRSGAAQASAGKADEEVPQSDIQKLKAFHLFCAFDLDANGYIEKADLDALARRVIENQRRQLNSPLHIDLQNKLAAYWSELVRYIDGNLDGRVSKEEFLQFAAKTASDPAGAPGRSMEAVADVLFTTADRDGTGTISEREFVQWTRACGILDSAAAAGFKLVDSDGSGRITRDEWHRFMRDLFRSSKVNDASAVVFGPGCRAP